MNDLPSPLAPTPPTPDLNLEALAQAHESLRTALHVTLVLLLILSASLFVFFLRELSLARRQIGELTQVITEYEKNALPVMEDFRSKLQQFSRTHPDFGPIYTRYFGSSNSAPLTPAGARPQPAPAGPNGARLPPTH